MVKWLKVGGFIFSRESCFHQSGDCKRKNNLTHYREPSPNAAAAAQFMRAEMLPSCYFIFSSLFYLYFKWNLIIV
ncbi:hypothetical protein ACSBR1_000376 [Camellia fascicularis]